LSRNEHRVGVGAREYSEEITHRVLCNLTAELAESGSKLRANLLLMASRTIDSNQLQKCCD
jgi:hypothetical protein